MKYAKLHIEDRTENTTITRTLDWGVYEAPSKEYLLSAFTILVLAHSNPDIVNMATSMMPKIRSLPERIRHSVYLEDSRNENRIRLEIHP